MEKDPEIKVRKKAVEVYSQLESSSVVLKYFNEKIEKGDYSIRLNIIEAMKGMNIDETAPILEKSFYAIEYTDLRNAILKFYAEKVMDSPVVLDIVQRIALDTKIKGFYDSVNKSRYLALQVLSRTGWDKSFPILKEIGERKDDPINTLALDMIAFFDKEKASDFFLSHLSDLKSKSYGQKFNILKNLGILKPEGLDKKLKEMYYLEPDTGTRYQMGRILKQYGMDPDVLEKDFFLQLKKTAEENKKLQQSSSSQQNSTSNQNSSVGSTGTK
jgi:hypothetical protein